ncbi:MAG: MBOAT family protein [Proteobacteria bacterium]|nr:MBOAT family protein [Pseudomonadota bacterium]
MLFNSLQFLVFFPVVLGLYFSIPPKRRWILLLAASYYFYACWKAEYLVLILASTAVDYTVALRMGREETKEDRRKWLWLSLATNLGLLFTFKYFNFANDSVRALLDSMGVPYDIPALDVILPVGISFYTFQTLAYTIDVYRGRIEPERHLGKFALYVAFFPQLVAGPIERAFHLLPQFHQEFAFDYDRMASGMRQMTWGMFKKVVVADRLAIYVNGVYNDPTAHSGFPIIAATYFFAFQIYCDFSGYSDIAIGAARIMGFDLMENFHRPYLANSISEFWKRWHISLSTWFRDYVYIPLGGNRVGVERWYANLFIVFLVSGMWHGANWTFLVWGGLHGLYLVFAIVSAGPRTAALDRIGLTAGTGRRRAFEILVTFHLALVAWVFFRANSVTDAVYLLQSGFTGLGAHLDALFALDARTLYQDVVVAVGVGKVEFLGSIVALLFVQAYDMKVEFRPAPATLTRRQRFLRFVWYDALILAMLLFGAYGQQQFIYFQF